VRCRVEPKICDFEENGARDGAAAADGPQAGEEDIEGKGFGEVVVGAGVEPLDDVGGRIARGEHQDGGLVAALAEAARNGEAVHAGQHAVQHDDVERSSAGNLEARRAIVRHHDGVALFGETALQQPGHAGFVLHHQNLHLSNRTESVAGLNRSGKGGLSAYFQVAMMDCYAGMLRRPAVLFLLMAVSAWAQAPAGAPGTITLADAVARGRQYGTQIQSAGLAVSLAKEDHLQARAATLPQVNAFSQYIYTQGNGTPSGVFVANDGVHVYNEQAVIHQEALALVRHGEVQRALAAQAVAQAKVDVARRGIDATVITDYYAIVAAQRKFVNAQISVREAEQFLDITQKLEKGGEAAHADVVKAQLLLQQRQRDLQDAQVNIDKTRIALGVLIFPDLRSDFAVEDDISQPAMLPPLPDAQSQAVATSPDLKAARLSIDAAGFDINVAKYGYLPSLGIDIFYGIDANQFAVNTNYPKQANGETPPHRDNLGYVAQATLNIPVWNWGATRSKIKQAELRRQQAQLDLTLAQRTLQGNLAGVYREAQGALAQIDSLRSSADLAAENLRLTLLRYQAGEATAFEVVDAQTTLTAARGAVDDGLARYRVALATLQSLTGII